jgi:hypothetical protein
VLVACGAYLQAYRHRSGRLISLIVGLKKREHGYCTRVFKSLKHNHRCTRRFIWCDLLVVRCTSPKAVIYPLDLLTLDADVRQQIFIFSLGVQADWFRSWNLDETGCLASQWAELSSSARCSLVYKKTLAELLSFTDPYAACDNTIEEAMLPLPQVLPPLSQGTGAKVLRISICRGTWKRVYCQKDHQPLRLLCGTSNNVLSLWADPK